MYRTYQQMRDAVAVAKLRVRDASAVGFLDADFNHADLVQALDAVESTFAPRVRPSVDTDDLDTEQLVA
jgi:hypothetical protein